MLPSKCALGSAWEAPAPNFIDLRSGRVMLTALAIVAIAAVLAIGFVWICIKEMEAADRSEDP